MPADAEIPWLSAALAEVRAWDAVVVVGAGLSVPARLPLTPGLEALVWQAIDADSAALAALRAEAGVAGNARAKAVMAEFHGDLSPAWNIIGRHPVARDTFQRGFAALDAARAKEFSRAHDALAEMLHRRHAEFVVSLNWDTKLESAWWGRYGQRLPRDRLFKPHGDAAEPEQDWILPGEARPLPVRLRERVAELVAERPRVLLVVGYAEGDELVVEQLTGPLSERWRVVRVGPRATGPFSVAASADRVLPELRDGLSSEPEAPGMTYVHFEPQHDLAWLLQGRGLGPLDVSVGVRIPEVDQLVRDLRATGSAILVGGSGEGKSLAAYQAAHDFWRDGCEVVRLVGTSEARSELLAAVRALPRPVVVVADDAQRESDDLVRSLIEAGGGGLYVLAVVSERSPITGAGVRIDASRAMEVLASDLLRDRPETVAAVRQLDPHVGDGYMDTPLERRLSEARTVAKTPWQLTFVLTAGWSRARGDIASLRAREHADVGLGLIAMLQLLTMDGSASLSALRVLSAELERPPHWLEDALSEAERMRLVVREGECFRLLHQRFASVILRLLLGGPSRDLTARAINAALARDDHRLGGVHWLLDELRFSALDAGLNPNAVVTRATARALVRRCWAAESGVERGSAAFVLNDIRRLLPDEVDLVAHAAALGAWISAGQPEAMSGVARLINDTFNRDERNSDSTLGVIYQHVDLDAIAALFGSLDWPDAYYLGELIDRFAVGPRAVVEDLAGRIDRAAVLALFRRWTQSSDARLYDVGDLCMGVASLDCELALDAIELVSKRLAELWQEDFAHGFNDMHDIPLLLGLGPSFLRKRKPSRRQRQVARALVEALDPSTVAAAVSRARQRDWEPLGWALTFVQEASRRHARRVVRAIDFEMLDEATAEFWPHRAGAMRGLLVGLALEPDYEPARSWIAKHVDKMQRIGELEAAIAPGASARRLRELDAPLQFDEHPHWAVVSDALAGLARYDSTVALRSVQAAHPQWVKAMTTLSDRESIEHALTVFDQIDPGAVPRALAEIDPDDARGPWTLGLQDGRVAVRRAVARLLTCAVDLDAPIAVLARELRQRFPSTASGLN